MTTDEKDNNSTTDNLSDGEGVTGGKSKDNSSNSILLIPFPKFIFMYPTLIVATLAAIIMYFGGYHAVDPPRRLARFFDGCIGSVQGSGTVADSAAVSGRCPLSLPLKSAPGSPGVLCESTLGS